MGCRSTRLHPYLAAFAFSLAGVFAAGPAHSHHPPERFAEVPGTVVARVPAAPEELDLLRRDHDILSYVWRLGYAVIQGSPDTMPSNAVIDWTSTARLTTPIAAASKARGGGIPGYPCYRTVEETLTALQALAASHPALAEWVDYGDSWRKTQDDGGYDLGALVITNEDHQPGVGDDPRPILMVMAAMHARELATAETATRFAEHLVAAYGVDPDITWLLDHNEIHVLAQQNPDGRKQAEAGLFWRKNTNQAYCGATSTNRGADLNRNATAAFWGNSSSGDECSEVYRGPGPGSEPETQALEAYQRARFPDQRDGDVTVGAPDDAQGIFISLHSFGEYVFYPWEGAELDTGNEGGYRSLAQRLADLTGYTACQNCCLGTAGGTSVDYAYEELGVASLTFELGTSFFQTCSTFESQIWPVNRDALLYAAKAARRPYQSSHGPVVSNLSITVDAGSGTALLTAEADDGAYAVNDFCGSPDPRQPVAAVTEMRWSLDAPPWTTAGNLLSADDGVFDEAVESASTVIDLSSLGGGRHLLFVRARDGDGNYGPPSAVFVDLPVLFSDGFE